MASTHRVYLSLGSNLGDRSGNLSRGLERLSEFGNIDKISHRYETEPVGYLDQPDFLNLVCSFTTELEPAELLRRIKLVEREMGREESFRNAPRPIDIDILLYDDIVLDTPYLTIPHPRMSERAFVLVPLAEIAPDLVHPVLNLAVHQMKELADQTGVRRHFPE